MKIPWHKAKHIVGWKGDFSLSWVPGTKETILRDVMRVRTLCELALPCWVWPAARNTVWPQEWAWTWGLWDHVCTREIDSYSLCCNFPHYHWIFSKVLKDTDWSWLYGSGQIHLEWWKQWQAPVLDGWAWQSDNIMTKHQCPTPWEGQHILERIMGNS